VNQLELIRHEATDHLADEAYAARVVKLLLSMYNQEPKDPIVYGTALIAALVGKPKRIVGLIVDPNQGLVAECTYLPTIADLQKWLKPKLPPAPSYLPEHRKLLPSPLEPEIPEEERKAGAARLRELANAIRERRRQEDQKRFGIKPLEWKQVETPIEKLFETLAGNLEGKGNVAIGGNEEDAGT
jgi:hypothetical protein